MARLVGFIALCTVFMHCTQTSSPPIGSESKAEVSETSKSDEVISETKGGLVEGIYQIDAKKYKLPNGLTLILSKNTKLPVFSVYTFYKVGSKHETKGMTGASHFLEHMMFKGAKKFAQGRFDKVIESNGGSSNAYTNYDETVYYESLPITSLELILDLESDRMQNLLLEPKAFESEKQVVLEERKMRYENSPRGQLYIGMMNKVFKGTPYEVPVIGTIEDIKSVSRDAVFKYFKDFYAPNNAIMLVVGDIDYDKTYEMIKKYFGPIPASEALASLKAQREVGFESKLNKNETDHYQGKSENPMFTLAFPGVKYGSRDGYVGDILSSVLAGSKSSFLNKKYVEGKAPILNSISASNYTLENTGVFFVMGEIGKKYNLDTLKTDLLKDFKNFCSNEINDREIQKVKNKYLIHFYDELQTNAGVANYLGTLESHLGDFTKYVDEIKTYQSITTAEVKKACSEFLLSKNHYYMSVWKNNSKKLNI